MISLNDGSFLNPFRTFSTLFQLNFMIDKSCDTDKIMYDLSNFCEHANCDVSQMLTNV